MGIGLHESFTKYHGRRERIAEIAVPGRSTVRLGLSDTARCAAELEAARRTLKNIAGSALREGELDAEAEKLHQHCRILVGVNEDPQTRRG